MSDSNDNNNMENYTQQTLITTNNINEIEDEDTLKLNRNSNYYDINRSVNQENIQTELSSVINTHSNIEDDEEALDKEEIDINASNKLNNAILKNEQNNSLSLLYGNDINDLTPKYIGRLRAFFYINKKPLILIGPDCKEKIIII